MKKQFIKKSLAKLKDSKTYKASLILYGLGALLIIFILVFTYRPLIIELQRKEAELRSLVAQLKSQRSNMATLKSKNLQGRLMHQKEISFAIDEITEKGRSFGLKFSSISPQGLQKTSRTNFQKLPINFKIESEYESLGQFLAFLEEFLRTIVEVESLSIRPKKDTLPELNVELLVNLYLETKDEEK